MQYSKPATLVLLLALTACAADDDPDTDKKADSKGMIVQAVEAQQVPKQKAQDLERQLQEDFEKQKQEIDRQSGDDG